MYFGPFAGNSKVKRSLWLPPSNQVLPAEKAQLALLCIGGGNKQEIFKGEG
jgi:hypothetical protein